MLSFGHGCHRPQRPVEERHIQSGASLSSAFMESCVPVCSTGLTCVLIMSPTPPCEFRWVVSGRSPLWRTVSFCEARQVCFLLHPDMDVVSKSGRLCRRNGLVIVGKLSVFHAMSSSIGARRVLEALLQK